MGPLLTRRCAIGHFAVAATISDRASDRALHATRSERVRRGEGCRAHADRVGKERPYLRRGGARAWKRDVPGAELHLLPGGHFLVEERADEIARLIREFVRRSQ
jgi:pimeloyl-ACP methyl ester carboxylesterase